MNKLRDKKTGQYVSMKNVQEPDANKIIDIWLKEETDDPNTEAFLKGCKAAALIGLTFFLFACGIYVAVRA